MHPDIDAAIEIADAWLKSEGRSAFAFQHEAWRAYLTGESGLINAPTGTGKTLAAWLGPVLEALDADPAERARIGRAAALGRRAPVRRGKSASRSTRGVGTSSDVAANANVLTSQLLTISGDASAAASAAANGDTTVPVAPPPQGPRVLWVTPLRALANDLVQSLREPLAALGSSWKVEGRTGDTNSSARRRQRERPPECLVITPESVSILLSYENSHDQLRDLRCVIVDEWHELLGSKRGTQLELALAHLRRLNPHLRIWGLSATLPNLDEAMHTLLGPRRQGRIVRAQADKRVIVDSIIPHDVTRFPWAGHLGSALVPEVIDAIDKARTTLLFTNTRSQAELWYRTLVESRLDWLTQVALHHGSLDRKLRARIEQAVKVGDLRCVVCTSSLDLGVDFPLVDQVIQVGSPKGIGRLVQRAGRSGHRPGETSRILCVPTHALELLEIAAARLASSEQRMEARRPLKLALDVLVQHVVTLAAGPGFDDATLLEEVRDTHAFADLTAAEWSWVLDFVTRGGTALQGYPQYRRVVKTATGYRVEDNTLARRHRMSIGTISSDTEMLVKWASGGSLGTVEESFIGRLRPGDDFMFAGRVLKLLRVKDMTAYVRASTARRTQVPRWQGGRLPLSVELADAVLEILGKPEDWPKYPEMLAAEPLLRLQERWSALPSLDTLLVERGRSRDGHHLFMYPFCGRLANEGIATLVASRWARHAPLTFTVSANDYGFELLSAQELTIDETTLEHALSTENLAADLLASVNLGEISRRRFRDIARIAGLIFQGFPGSGKTTRQLQASSGLVFDVLEQYDPDNLLLLQSRLEVLEQQLEFTRVSDALKRISTRRLLITNPHKFTPLAFPLWAGRLQTQMISSESWQSRIERAARDLEAYALRAA